MPELIRGSCMKKQKKIIKVYIASPYTIGDIAVNVKRQMDVADELINLGFAPFIPLLSHFQHLYHSQPYEIWLQLDSEWLTVCDCILRLDGASRGADQEVELAKKLNMPRFYSIRKLCEYYKKNEK